MKKIKKHSNLLRKREHMLKVICFSAYASSHISDVIEESPILIKG